MFWLRNKKISFLLKHLKKNPYVVDTQKNCLTGTFLLSNKKISFLLKHFKKNICCGFSKELSHWNVSSEYPKPILQLMAGI